MTSSTEFSLTESLALLTRTPATLDALLRGLPDAWIRGNEGKDSWSPYDIMGHMVLAEREDWIPRTRLILEHGDARPFAPFDRFTQMKEPQLRSLEELLDDFAALRGEGLAALPALNLKAEDLIRPGR